MQKTRSSERVYTQADFDSAQGIVERVIIHLDQPRKFLLTESERRHFERLRVVFGIMLQCNTQRARIRRIAQVIPVSERSATRYMTEAKELFVDMMRVDRDWERHFLKEKLYGLAQKAEDAGDLELAMKCLDKVVKLEGYDREDSGIKPGDIQLPALIFTADAKALTSNIEEYEEALILESETVAIPAGEAAG